MSDDARRHFRLETSSGVTVVRFVDAKIVTEEDIQQIGEDLNRLVDEQGHRRLLLDFGQVQYLSSAALGKLINLKKRVAAVDGALKLCSVHPDLLEVFRITRLDTVFDIFKDEKAALAAF
jgi:anti-sigma B factor antagonist